MTNQSDKQASVRTVTGTTLNYEGDWHALWDITGVPVGPFNQRMLSWINSQLGASYTEINGAMAAFAIANGVSTWDQLGTFTPGGLAPSNPYFSDNAQANPYFTDNAQANPLYTSGF